METEFDVTVQLAELLALPEEERLAITLSATVSAATTRTVVTKPVEPSSAPLLADASQVILRALQHERMMWRIARQADVDPETMLELLLAQFKQAAASPERAPFSESEHAALLDAGVDLSGPPVTAEDPAAVTAARFAAMFGQALTVPAAATRLSVTPGRIRQRIADGTLYGIRAPRGGEWRLPLWQFRRNEVLPGLEAVLPALPPRLHPLSVYGFMTTANVDLSIDGDSVSPVDWLGSGGDPDLVAELAAALPSVA